MKKYAILALVPFLFACNEKTYTIDDYMKNEEIYNLFLKKCQNGELHEQELNCQNVYKAKKEKQKRKWKEARERNGAKL